MEKIINIVFPEIAIVVSVLSCDDNNFSQKVIKI